MGVKKYALAALLAASLVLALNTTASAALLNYTAFLEGAQEVPANGSPAKGVGLFTVDTDTNIFSWQVIYTDALLSGPVVAAHIHGPALPGATAPPIINFADFGGLGTPIVGSTAITALELADLNAGLWYVNLHTAAFETGEIRGQLVPGVPIDVIVPEPSTIALAGLGLGGVCLALARRRK